MIVEVGLRTERVHFTISFLLLFMFDMSQEKSSGRVENRS